MAEKRVIEYEAASELANDDWLLIDGVTEGTRKARPNVVTAELGAQVTNIATTVGGLVQVAMGHEQSFAPSYDERATYDVGDLVMQFNCLHRCTAPTTGPWDSSKWQLATVAEQLEESGKIDDVQVNGVSVVTDKVASIDLTGMQADIDSKQADTKIGGTSILDNNKVANLDFLASYGEASGSIASFNDGAAMPLKSLKVGIEPIQSGSGDPSPTNIRPISGWDEVNVARLGKNLCKSTVHGYVSSSDDLIVIDNDTESAIFYAHEGQTYTISSSATMDKTRVALVGTDNVVNYTPILQREILADNVNTWTATWTGWTVWYKCSSRQTAFDNSAQVELGSTATTYEPYNGQVYTIQLGDTYYGGELDVVSGVLTVTDGFISSYNGETLPSTWISDRDVYAEGTIPTIGAEVCYKLATPLTIQLPPTAVKSLLGTNNLWADSGEILECKYVRDNSAVINDLIARVTALENA